MSNRFAFVFVLIAATAGCGSVPAQLPLAGALPATRAQNERILHFFSGAPDGDLPTVGHLMLDGDGNLYGTTSAGGTGSCKFRGSVTGCGTVFELTPASSGWTERVLYSFKDLADGAGPYGTLTLDGTTRIFGVTMGGGNRGCVPLFWVFRGCGTVFELDAHGDRWTKKTIHVFSGAADGGNPLAGLVLDSAGNLYGTTHCGGTLQTSCFSEGEGFGIFFELRPSTSGAWSDITLHLFGRHRGDGVFPLGDLTVDARGNIYGTADNIFEMHRKTAKQWLYRQLLLLGNNSFEQGYYPNGGLAFDPGGNIYGTMARGGNIACDCGLVYEARAGSRRTETVLHTFSGGKDGASPFAGLTLDPSGRLFGTTANGGDSACNNGGGCGVAFQLNPNGSKSVERILHTFKDDASDGGMPESALIFGARANLYGTTEYGGPGPNLGPGSVFELAR